jgi:adenylylsulfate kinase
MQETAGGIANLDNRNGLVLWFTGLSGAGKTTTARRVAELLKEAGRSAELLDGDELRSTVCSGLGFSKEDRMENIRRIAYIAGLLARHGVIVLVSAITPYREMRDYARNKLPGFVEIYVKCPLEVCEKRDVKGLYARARRNEIERFTGISDPYEEPDHPDITVRTDTCSLEENSQKIVAWIERVYPAAGLAAGCGAHFSDRRERS